MNAAAVITPEQQAIEILHEARIFAAHCESDPLGKPDFNDYETYKKRVQKLDLVPAQYALACGAIADILGL